MNMLHDRPVMQDPQRENAAPGAQYGGLPPEGGELRIFRLDLLRALQLHRRLVIVLTVLGLAGAVAETVRVWLVYKAQSQVYIQPAAPKVLAQANDSGRWAADASSYESFIQQQVQSASQPPVLMAAIRKLGPGVWQQSGESDQAAVERLGKSLKTERVSSSYQVTITAQAHSAEMAAQVANAVAASLVENVSSQQKAGNPERITMLQEERTRIQNELNADRSEQENLSKQLGMAAVSSTASDVYQGEANEVRSALIKARTEHDEARARLAALGGVKDSSSRSLDALADETISTDPGLNSMKETLEKRRAMLVTQMANLTPSNPQYKQGAAELAQIDAALENNSKNLRNQVAERIQQRLRADLTRTAEVEERLNAQLGTLAGTAVGATPKLQRANDLASDILRLQSRFAAVDDQLHNMLLENSAPGAAFLSSAAEPPLHPSYGVLLRKAGPLALGGMLLGMLIAVALHRFDTRIYVAADVERVLGVGPMAQLPDRTEVSTGIAEEHYFRLSAALEHAHQQGGMRSCIFTGVGPGVGVTTIASQIKVTLATMGRATTMVDTSGTPPPPAQPSEAAENSGSTSLVAMQRGNRSTALLQKFAAEKETPAPRMILTDTAPLLISAETEYLARFVDAVLVVIQSGVTTRGQLRAVANTLQRLEVKAVGFVLNRVSLSKADPVFRQAVQDMDRHQQAQARAGNLKEQNLAAFGALPQPGSGEQVAPIASLAAEIASRAQAMNQAPHAPAPLAPPPEPAPAARAEMSRREEPAPVPEAAPPLPPRLEAPAFAEPAPIAPLPRNPKSRSDREELAYRYERTLEENREQLAAEAPRPVEPERKAAPPAALPARQIPLRAQVPYAAPVPVASAEPAAVSAPPVPPSFTQILAQVERGPSFPEPAPEAVPAPAQAPLPEALPWTAYFTQVIAKVEPEPVALPSASTPPMPPRFEGLRNMAATAELRNLRKNAEPEEKPFPARMAAAEFWPPAPAPEFYEPAPPAENPVALQRTKPAEIQRVVVEETVKEIPQTYTPPNMRPWQEDEDEITTLPFKRGQYQKRR